MKTPSGDPIAAALHECEQRLANLATEGRLSTQALATFVELAAQIRCEMERRKGERRSSSRGTPDRRVTGRLASEEDAVELSVSR